MIIMIMIVVLSTASITRTATVIRKMIIFIFRNHIRNSRYRRTKTTCSSLFILHSLCLNIQGP